MVAFIRKYQYNSDMAPNRMQLQNMCKKDNESFKEYAQRWRDLAAQVVPPMTERERDDNNDNGHTAGVLQ